MRIIVNGQQAFGKAVLEALLERGEDVVAVYCAPDRPGRPVDPMKEVALERGLKVVQPASFKDPAVLEEFKAFASDLGVMAYVIQLVPESILNAPRLGTIQYHPSLLPRHRGPSSINWPIIQGETRTGLTIFWPDKGLDTGPILLQKQVEIGPDSTLGQIYFDHLFPMGVAALLESVDLVKAGTASRTAQDESAATYQGWCRKDDVLIDWNRPAQVVYNLIRGADPQPGAWTTHAGRTLQIFDGEMLAAAGGAPGEVTQVGENGVVIAAADAAILAKRLRGEDGKKRPAHEVAADTGMAPGTRLG